MSPGHVTHRAVQVIQLQKEVAYRMWHNVVPCPFSLLTTRKDTPRMCLYIVLGSYITMLMILSGMSTSPPYSHPNVITEIIRALNHIPSRYWAPASFHLCGWLAYLGCALISVLRNRSLCYSPSDSQTAPFSGFGGSLRA